MRIDINVHPVESTNYGFAKIDIRVAENGYIGALDLDFLPLASIPNRSTISLDLLYLSAVVYSVDKIVRRKRAADAWTRQLDLHMPVENPDRWNQVKEDLQCCLSFLTGDNWAFCFTQLDSPLIRPRNNQLGIITITPVAVSLFSGGLDSLIGVINWLEENDGQIILAGHYDGSAPSAKGDQEDVSGVLNRHYQARIHRVQVRVGQNPAGKETTFRSRSFLFLSMGMYIAAAYDQIPLIVPENGTIGINVPLTPSRRGSCSTRTTHPNFMRMYVGLIRRLGLINEIINPLEFFTKGECVENCLNRTVLEESAPLSVSCGKQGHKRTWLNRHAKGCGRCMPCIYRRAALHKIDMDTEEYGRNICSGDVSVDQDKALADDLRACVSFLSKNYNANQVANILLANGPVAIENLAAYSGVVVRAMDEIRDLFRDKAIETLRRRAGIQELG